MSKLFHNNRKAGVTLAKQSTGKSYESNGNLINVPVPRKGHLKSYELYDWQGKPVYSE